MRRMILLAVVVLAFAVPRASAQSDLHILHCGQDGFRHTPFSGALSRLGYADETTLVFQREDLLLDALRSRNWDLVIIRWFRAFEGPLAGDVIDELADYVDGGGKLIFSMAELDEMPQMWPILGIEGAEDLRRPLEDIRSPRDGFLDPSVRHPAFASRAELVPVFDPMGSDFGDWLHPGPGSYAIAEYFPSERPAIVIARRGNVITNGQHWDFWGAVSLLAEDQILWLLGCPADLDGDGALTVFDFFEFQNRFDSGGAAGFADFSYDGRLDVFDFLEFLNMFEAGC